MTARAACAVPDCSRPADTRGWCAMHYHRWLRHGDPHTVLQPRGGHNANASGKAVLERLAGETAGAIAAAVGVSRRTVVRWRNGGNVQSPDRVAVALGYHPGELWPEQWSA